MFEDLLEESSKILEAKQHFKVHMFDINVQLQRQKDMFDKYISDIGKAIIHTTEKENKSNVEKMNLQ